MVDRDKATRLLGVLADALADLRRYAATIDRATMRESRDTQHMVLHALYVAAQAVVDLAMHLGADAGARQPVTYQDGFRILGEMHVVAEPLARRLAGWAGFRNVLAHHYAVVDLDRAYDALGEIGDLEEFASIVSRMLQDAGPS